MVSVLHQRLSHHGQVLPDQVYQCGPFNTATYTDWYAPHAWYLARKMLDAASRTSAREKDAFELAVALTSAQLNTYIDFDLLA